MTKNNLKIVKSSKNQEAENKEFIYLLLKRTKCVHLKQ